MRLSRTYLSSALDRPGTVVGAQSLRPAPVTRTICFKSVCLILLLCIGLSACSSLQSLTAAPTPITPETIANIDASLSSLADKRSFSGSILIAQGEKVLLSKGYGLADVDKATPNTPETIFRIGSVTKQFTAMAILILQDQKKLDVRDRICLYIPDCPPAWQAITIHHLLTHTSGLSDREIIFGLISVGNKSLTPVDILALFKDAPLEFQPGEKFEYSNAGYIVLGYIIEQVSGQSYEAFLERWIFTPLNMANTGYFKNCSGCNQPQGVATGYMDYGVTPDPSNITYRFPYSAGELFSTVEDLFLWDQALFIRKSFPEKLLNQLFTAHVPSPVEGIRYTGDVSYGYGWLIGERLGRRVIGHDGLIAGFVSLNEVYPDAQVTIIVLSNLQHMDNSVLTLPSDLIFGQP
jgi:CubicO group peptidase (beta-lactamase class C family)